MPAKTTKKVSADVAAKSAAKSKKKTISNDEFLDYVQKRAYFIWQNGGQFTGSDYDIWLRAENEIRSEYSVK